MKSDICFTILFTVLIMTSLGSCLYQLGEEYDKSVDERIKTTIEKYCKEKKWKREGKNRIKNIEINQK